MAVARAHTMVEMTLRAHTLNSSSYRRRGEERRRLLEEQEERRKGVKNKTQGCRREGEERKRRQSTL